MKTTRLALAALLFTLGCDDTSETPDAGPTPMDDAGSPDAGPQDAGAPREVPCVDEQISQLMLLDTVASGAITDETEGDAFQHHVDATAGGRAPTESFVYARFEDDGLQKVEVDDEAAFESTEWHIAFRRFVVRVNGGVSGPSRVTVARTAPGTDFEALDAVPEGLMFRQEAYFTETCEYVSDGSGIGSPATALSSFWSYAGCVSMTGNVYVLALPSGRHVKLEVLSYYNPDVQDTCDESNTISSPSGSGNVRIQWAFLD
ncbi:MAG TPA: HmuY family protein [Sandaracinaceae bacterium LLY-WYZ-13_1]|nr:HmuY family protein [Sandaracinaceae bacterium LLY-WYZ-13_1]